MPTFTPPTEQDTIANLINTYSALIPIADDLNKGAVIRNLFTAFALELKRYYSNLTEQSYLLQQTVAYNIFNFQLLQPQAAYTMETLTVPIAPTSDVPIPAGTLFGIPSTSIQYQTAGEETWPSGQTSVSVRVVCTQTGSIGNTPANTITNLITSIPGLSNMTATNSKDVINGTDLETDSERLQRFTEFIASIHCGDGPALAYGAKQAQLLDNYGYINEQVSKVQVVEGSGSNTIYIDNGTYDTSDNLVTQCQTVIDGYIDSNGNFVDGYKAAGIPSTVQKANYQMVSISAVVTPDEGFTFDMIEQTIIDTLNSLVKSLNVGDTLYLKDIGLAIGNVVGVLNYTISSPVADTIPSAGTLLQMAPNNPNITSA